MNEFVLVAVGPNGFSYTAPQVVFQNNKSQALDCSAGGRYLFQYGETVAIILHHPAKSANLSLDPIYPADDLLVVVAAKRHRSVSLYIYYVYVYMALLPLSNYLREIIPPPINQCAR